MVVSVCVCLRIFRMMLFGFCVIWAVVLLSLLFQLDVMWCVVTVHASLVWLTIVWLVHEISSHICHGNDWLRQLPSWPLPASLALTRHHGVILPMSTWSVMLIGFFWINLKTRAAVLEPSGGVNLGYSWHVSFEAKHHAHVATAVKRDWEKQGLLCLRIGFVGL